MSYTVTLKNGVEADNWLVELQMNIFHDQSGNHDKYVKPEDTFLGTFEELDYNGWELIGDGEVIAHICFALETNLWRVRNFNEWEPDKYFHEIEIDTKGKVNKTMVFFAENNIRPEAMFNGVPGVIMLDNEYQESESESYNSNARIDWEGVVSDMKQARLTGSRTWS